MTLASVVIPAHDEESVIERCLSAMTAGADPGELEIVVVCNGCSDGTAERAHSAGPGVRVIETEIASKSHALRLGDGSVEAFPRFYVDADVLLPLASIREVARVLEAGEALAAAPRMRVDLAGRSFCVRAYYAVWMLLPYHASGMIGSGVYALSKAGRARFDTFPDIISDDGFVRLQFAPGERRTVDSAWFEIQAPRTLRGVVGIKTRSQKGKIQLERLHPRLLRNDPRDYRGSFATIAPRPRLWIPSLIYLYVALLTKLRGYWMNYVGELGDWERDETSRNAGDGSRTGSHS